MHVYSQALYMYFFSTPRSFFYFFFCSLKLSTLFFSVLLLCRNRYKTRRAIGCGALITLGPAHRPEDAGARLRPRPVGKAAAAGASPHSEAAANPETVTDQRVPEAA